MSFQGFDHIDVRIPSLKAVEAFYEALMARLGLTRKRTAFVDAQGEWLDAGPDGAYNTVEFYEEPQPDRVSCFIGFIERADTPATFTRIAFRVAADELGRWPEILAELGARNIEPSSDMNAYPAIFFEDPAGMKLEVIARKPRS